MTSVLNRDYTDATWVELGVFKREGDLSYYIIITWSIVIAFYIIYKMCEYCIPEIMTVVDPNFANLKEKDKKEYYSRVVSNIHAVAALMLGLKSVFASCDEGSILTNDECLMVPQKLYLHAILVSTAFCIYDLYVCMFEIQYTL